MKKNLAIVSVMGLLLLAGCSSAQSYGPEVIAGDANFVTINWWGSINGNRNLDLAANAYCQKFDKMAKFSHDLSRYRVVYDCVKPPPVQKPH